MAMTDFVKAEKTKFSATMIPGRKATKQYFGDN